MCSSDLFQLDEYPSLLDSQSKSYETTDSDIQQKASSDAKERSCLESITENCDRLTSKITEPIEDRCVGYTNKKAEEILLSNEDYYNLRNVLIAKNGIKKLYNNIFPKQSKSLNTAVIDISSKKEMENFVESQFKGNNKLSLSRSGNHSACVIQ